MTYIDWFKIGTREDFYNNETPTFEVSVNSQKYGVLDLVLHDGIDISVEFGDYYVPLNLNGKNPFYVGTNCFYVDNDGGIWLGFKWELLS
jgi:hypothetical protein